MTKSKKSGKYPKIGDKRVYSPAKGTCKLCQKPGADVLVTIQLDIFRGHDKVIKAHRGCTQGKRDEVLMSEILDLGILG